MHLSWRSPVRVSRSIEANGSEGVKYERDRGAKPKFAPLLSSSSVVSDIFELISLWAYLAVVPVWFEEVFCLFGQSSCSFWSSLRISSRLISSISGILFLLLFMMIRASSCSRAFYLICDSLKVLVLAAVVSYPGPVIFRSWTDWLIWASPGAPLGLMVASAPIWPLYILFWFSICSVFRSVCRILLLSVNELVFSSVYGFLSLLISKRSLSALLFRSANEVRCCGLLSHCCK